MKPDVWLHVRQLIGQNVAYHLHGHPITRHLLPHSQSSVRGTHGCMKSRIPYMSSINIPYSNSLLEQFNVAHDELLPVDKDHGHLLLRQQLTLQQRFMENLQISPHLL